VWHLIHFLEQCRVCAWSDEAKFGAARAATKHTVSVEQGIVYTVRIKKAKLREKVQQ